MRGFWIPSVVGLAAVFGLSMLLVGHQPEPVVDREPTSVSLHAEVDELRREVAGTRREVEDLRRILVELQAGVADGVSLARAPASDAGEGAASALQDFATQFTAGEGELTDPLPGSWPTYRGPGRDNVVRDGVTLADAWPDGGPPRLWRVEMLGEGYAAAAVHEGRVYVLDYDREARADTLRCLSLADGRELWRVAYAVEIRNNHGMSRTIPTVSDGRVVTIGPMLHVLCVDALSGDVLWALDLAERFGVEVPPWYAGQCPLVDEGRLILGVGGREALMVALDLETGEEIWRTPNPDGWQMSHASVTPIEVDGLRMYVYTTLEEVLGVDAAGGELLWATDVWKGRVANTGTPVDLGGGRIMTASAYNAGAAIFQVARQPGGGASVEVLHLLPRDFGSEQQVPIFHEGYVYKTGIVPRTQMTCIDPVEGTLRWASPRTERFGRGPFLLADGKLYILDDNGRLTMARATPDEWVKLDEAVILSNPDLRSLESWGPLALADGLLIARDLTQMVCVDLRPQGD